VAKVFLMAFLRSTRYVNMVLIVVLCLSELGVLCKGLTSSNACKSVVLVVETARYVKDVMSGFYLSKRLLRTFVSLDFSDGSNGFVCISEQRTSE
jgi:hypothetical protein